MRLDEEIITQRGPQLLLLKEVVKLCQEAKGILRRGDLLQLCIGGRIIVARINSPLAVQGIP